jgi:argininosuccinate lyase
MTSGYHRDFQLMKPPLFRSVDRCITCLQVAAHALDKVEFDPGRITEATDPGIHSAEEAFRLVHERGISFREAYRLVSEQK